MEEINRTLVSYSREVADAADHKVYVAADITTSGKMMAPAGEMTYEAAFEMYQEQIGILKDSGVDLIVAETMINIEETLAAVDAASTVCELPIMCTMTVDADGSIFSGGNAIEAAVSLEAAGADAVGVNCSVGPDQLVSVIRNIKENVSIPVIASGGAGTKEHFYDALTKGKADAALAASLFHYKELEIRDLKQYLRERGISVRL